MWNHGYLFTSDNMIMGLVYRYEVECVLCFRYVNGKTFMEDVATALEEAEEEIFITDWWYV